MSGVVTVVGPVTYAGNQRVVAARAVTFTCVGPDGAVLRDSDGALVGSVTVTTDPTGQFSVALPSNAQIDAASGVGPPGTYWQATVGVIPAVSWRFRTEVTDEGTSIVLGSAAYTIVDPTPRGWVPLAGPSGSKGDKGDQGSPGAPGAQGNPGSQGNPGALTPGVIASRPATAIAGQSYYATDTDDTFTWSGSSWVRTAQGTPSAYLTGFAASNIPIVAGSNNAVVTDPALTGVDVQLPSRLCEIAVSTGMLAAGAANKTEVWVQYSTNGGSTWTSGGYASSGVALVSTNGLAAITAPIRWSFTPGTAGNPPAGSNVRFRCAIFCATAQTYTLNNLTFSVRTV